MTQVEVLPGLPVKGYAGQSPENVRLVNQNKVLEEKVLRQIDAMFENVFEEVPDGTGYEFKCRYDPEMIAKAREDIMQGFMWLNRAVFQPKRLTDAEILTLDA